MIPRRNAQPFVAFILVAGATLQIPGRHLESYDLSADGGLRETLPRALEEISGLAISPEGKLFAHNDERAIVYELSPEDGKILKSFSAGFGGIRGDFEGIAIAGNRFFLLTSAGELVEFREGQNGSALGYHVYLTGLRDRCETEGLAYDPSDESLLVPCKTPRSRELEGHLTVFTFQLSGMELYPVPRVFIPLTDLDGLGLDPEFHVSGIEVHPETGALLLVAAREEALLELSPQGHPLAGRALKRKAHPQPEGISFLADGTLLLADEGQGGRGRLTRYPLLERGEGGGTP
jgi:uncharacterized protein YjiK